MLHHFGVSTLNPNNRTLSLAVSSPAQPRDPVGCATQLSKHPVCLSVISVLDLYSPWRCENKIERVKPKYPAVTFAIAMLCLLIVHVALC
jgi:hypothetical protein